MKERVFEVKFIAMKKLKFILLVLLIILTAGCSKEYKVSFIDSITKEAITKISVDNKELSGETVALKEGTHRITSPSYNALEFNVESDTTIPLVPVSYLVIDTSNTIDKAIVDGNEESISNVILNGKTVYVISPIDEGTHSIRFESNFFKPYEAAVNIKEGENILKVSLVEDTATFEEFLKKLTFPLEGDGEVYIEISGKASNNPVDKTLTVKKTGDKLTIEDDYITYSFKGSTFVESSAPIHGEQAQVLEYAKTTIETFLKLRDTISNMQLNAIKGNTYVLSKIGKFDERNLSNTIEFSVNGTKVNQIKISMLESDTNTNLLITMEVK